VRSSPHEQLHLIYYRQEPHMPKYVIERDIPKAGDLTQQQIQAISQKSCSVLQNLGSQIQWKWSKNMPNKEDSQPTASPRSSA